MATACTTRAAADAQDRASRAPSDRPGAGAAAHRHTPIQNSLAELWGLLSYVDPSGTLGRARWPTFKTLFCEQNDSRRLVPEQAHELRRRLIHVVQRTLRRQAQEFLEKPFVDRRAKLYQYSMSQQEKELYDDVTNYLLSPSLNAFQGARRGSSC